MDQATVIEKLKRFKLLLENHYNVNSVILFGSYANGHQREDSDIDVAVVINQPEGDYLTYTSLLWKLRRQIDVRIEPILFEEGLDPSGFLEEIKTSGIQI